MRTLALALATVLVLVAAGCIAPDDAHNNAPAGARTTNSGGAMTSKESRADNAGPCANATAPNVNIPPSSRNDAFCATRTITVTGTISGISRMDVDVASFNGDVKLHPSNSGAWGFVATLKARGATADDAKANLDKITFAWSHVNGDNHFLSASAKKDGEGSGYSAQFDVTLDPGIAYSMVTSTTNGDATVQGLRADQLSLHTTNGDIDADATVQQASLATTNGDVKGALHPNGSGRISATTTNGRAKIQVPEDADHGYDASLKTTNGKVTIGAHDGSSSPCPTGEYYTPPCTERTFRTKGFDGRSIQSLVTIVSTNGDVELSAL